MSWVSTTYLELKDTGFNFLTATIGMLLVQHGSSLEGEGEPNIATLAAYTLLNEATFSGYVRKTLAGKAVTRSTTRKRSEISFNPVNFGNVASLATPLAGLLLFNDTGGSDATRQPLIYSDSVGIFPFSGGEDLIVACLENGSIVTYGA